MLADFHLALGKGDIGRLCLVKPAGRFNHPLLDGFGSLFCRHAVEVRAGGGSCRRGVGHLVGHRRGNANLIRVNTEFLGNHLRNLHVEPLPHLGSAMVYRDRPVRIDMHQCTSLVEMLEGEGNAELYRVKRDTAFHILVGRIELRNLPCAAADSAMSAPTRRPPH